ncbi:hypothetical protein [Nostoc sp. MG11]|nr:hypothetical protein [Nostoc sp. MG11]
MTLLRRYRCANGSSSWGTRGIHGVGIEGEPPSPLGEDRTSDAPKSLPLR